MKLPEVTIYAAVSLVAAQLPAAWAQAQTAPGATVLEEIVVTAERRETDIQKTATSVSVRSGSELRDQGRYTLQQMLEDVVGVGGGAASAPVPGGSGVDTAAPGLTIRGIKSNAAAIGNVTSVAAAAAVYVDGVFEGVGGGYDIDRVEILRGPQGTLYGRSATSGLMALHTNDPKLGTLGGDALVELGNFDLQHYTGVLNAPLAGDVLAVRVAGNYYKRDGYFVEDGDGSVTSKDGKVKLLFKPSDDFSLLLGYALQDNDTGNGGTTITLATPDTYQFTDTPLGTGTNKFRQYWALLDWNFGFATLTYQPAYRTWESHADTHSNTGAIIDSVIDVPRDRFHTEELRLSSNPDSKLIWQVGALYYKNSLSSHIVTTQDLFGTVTTPLDALVHDKTTTATGAFAEATYPVTDSWRVTAGVRYDHTKVSLVEDYTAQSSSPPFAVNGGTLSGDAGVREFDNTTYKVRLEHDLTPENMLYASISTGFSPGDVTITADLNSKPYVLELSAETLTAYEIGSKNRFSDDRVQANGSVYYYDYGAYQNANVNINPPSLPGVTNITLSAPAKVWGAELETIFQLTSNDRAAVNLAYTEAYFVDKDRSFDTGTGTSVTFEDFFTRDEIPDVIPFTATLSYDHIFRLPADSTLTLHGGARYRSAYDLTNLSVYYLDFAEYIRVGDQWIGDLSATWASANSHFSVTGYVRNIDDNEYKSYAFIQTTTSTAVLSTPYDPRTYGVIMSVQF